jgi:hypothetical protein
LLFEIRNSWVLFFFSLRFHLSTIVQDPSSSVDPLQRMVAHTTLLNQGIEAVTLVLPRAKPESGSAEGDDKTKTNPFQAVHACIVGLVVEATVRRINVLERPLDDFVTIYLPLSNSSVISFGMIDQELDCSKITALDISRSLRGISNFAFTATWNEVS